MQDVPIRDARRPTEGATFAACLASILELPLADVPEPPPGEEPTGWRVSRWLGGLGLGLYISQHLTEVLRTLLGAYFGREANTRHL